VSSAIKQASTMIKSNHRRFSRGVIVLLSNSFGKRFATAIQEASNEFKETGQELISIDYSMELSAGMGLEDIASPGYYFKGASNTPDINAGIISALCDGCYSIGGAADTYKIAEDNCETRKGFLPTVYDDEHNYFLSTCELATVAG
ncbi:hypothetical protein PMAYCL1PPCAC_32959, partial [Pristionchus mayeri]